MGAKGEEPVGSMGTDTPLACLSDRPQPLFNYFRQLFAQVTNPPIDPIREELVMSLISYIGTERNILDETPENCHTLKLPHPILTNRDLEKLRRVSSGDLLATTLPALFRAEDGERGLKQALDDLSARASHAVASGYSLLIISDRGVDSTYAPIPSLLAMAAVHNRLVREKTRTVVALIIESGEPREVMHFALLIGYGASAVNPYLAIETLHDLKRRGLLPHNVTGNQAEKNFIKAINKGLLKTFSKMGISTLQSYRGAQVFEAVGLNQSLIDSYFAGTASRIEGIGLDVLAREAQMKHAYAFQPLTESETELVVGGHYQYRVDGEYHLLNPETISKLQHSVRQNNPKTFEEYTSLIDDQSRNLCTLRGLLKLKYLEHPISIDDVEPAKEIVKRFTTGAMSYGSISKEAHETLAIAMNRIGGMSNTGEGGEDEARFKPDSNGDSRRSAVKQVASGRFGVTTNYLVNADELQIKMAQGAKPGEGGQLPGHKVDEVIASVRHSTPGVGLISPPPHHDIYSIEDLAQLIYDLKNVNPRARIAVKLVSEVGVGTVAAGVSKAHADVVLISGDSGGTGASPLEFHQARRPALGARPRGNPAGPAAQRSPQPHQGADRRQAPDRPRRRHRRPARRRRIRLCHHPAHRHGLHHDAQVPPQHLLGRHRHARPRPPRPLHRPARARHQLLLLPRRADSPAHGQTRLSHHGRDDRPRRQARHRPRRRSLESQRHRPQLHPLLAHAAPPRCSPLRAQAGSRPRISPRPRSSSRRPRPRSNPKSRSRPPSPSATSIAPSAPCSAAKSPAATAPPACPTGPSISNSPARPDKASAHSSPTASPSNSKAIPTITSAKASPAAASIAYPPRTSPFLPEESILVGNVVLYGATSGEVYLNGIAGERFAVRNSGATAVVEGVGDHGCEYMTRGLVAVIGSTGRNFAAGMSGGIAYVYDDAGDFATRRCNKSSVDLEPLEHDEDIATLRALLEKHRDLTGSPRAAWILDNWAIARDNFIKVFPHEYKRVLGIARPDAATSSSTATPLVAASEAHHG